MISVAIFVFLIALLLGLCGGCITALVIYWRNKKSVVQKSREYSKNDRKELMANNEILLSKKEEHSANNFN